VNDDHDDAGSPDTQISRPMEDTGPRAKDPPKPPTVTSSEWRREEPEDLVPPASSRQPRSIKDELPLDDGLPGILDPEADVPESEERPPASRKVASVRGTEIGPVEDFSTWEIEGIAAEPPPTRKAGWLGGDRKPQPEDIRVIIETRAESSEPAGVEQVRRHAPPADIVSLARAARSFQPATFGELLDAALALGEDLD